VFRVPFRRVTKGGERICSTRSVGRSVGRMEWKTARRRRVKRALRRGGIRLSHARTRWSSSSRYGRRTIDGRMDDDDDDARARWGDLDAATPRGGGRERAGRSAGDRETTAGRGRTPVASGNGRRRTRAEFANEMTDAFVSLFLFLFVSRSPVRLLSSFKAAMRARRRSSSRMSMTAALRVRTATRSSAASPRSRARYETRRDDIRERFNVDGCQSAPVDGGQSSSFDARVTTTKTLEGATSLARSMECDH